MTGKMDCCGLTDNDSNRTCNHDQFLIADLEKSMRIHSSSLSLDDHSRIFGNSQAKLLMVADGTGTSESADLASRLVIDSVTRYCLNHMPWADQTGNQSDDSLSHSLICALERCQERMETDVQDHPERAGMSASLTLSYINWPHLHVIHTGHSRCYLFRESKLYQLTRDHSLAEKLVTNGTLQADEIPEVWQNLLLNSIGGDGDSVLSPDICKMQIQMGDSILLCTDGLTKSVPYSVISEILSQNSMAEELCTRLINEAQQRGATDNTTVVIARFLDLGDQDLHFDDAIDVETGNTTSPHMTDQTSNPPPAPNQTVGKLNG